MNTPTTDEVTGMPPSTRENDRIFALLEKLDDRIDSLNEKIDSVKEEVSSVKIEVAGLRAGAAQYDAVTCAQHNVKLETLLKNSDDSEKRLRILEERSSKFSGKWAVIWGIVSAGALLGAQIIIKALGA